MIAFAVGLLENELLLAIVPMGRCHNPLLRRGPSRTVVFCFSITTLCLLNVAVHSSSHSWPIEMRDPVVRFGKRCACRAWLERIVGSLSCPEWVAVNMSPFAT